MGEAAWIEIAEPILRSVPYFLQALRIERRGADVGRRSVLERDGDLKRAASRLDVVGAALDERAVVDDGALRAGAAERLVVLPVALLALLAAVAGFLVHVAFARAFETSTKRQWEAEKMR